MLEILEKIFGEFQLPYELTRLWVLLYGWIIMFIPSLILILRKNGKPFFSDSFWSNVAPKMMLLGYIHNLFTFLMITIASYVDGCFYADTKVFLIVDAIFWIVHIFCGKRVKKTRLMLANERMEEGRKQKEEKEQKKQNEIEDMLDNIVAKESTTQSNDRLTSTIPSTIIQNEIGDMLDNKKYVVLLFS